MNIVDSLKKLSSKSPMLAFVFVGGLSTVIDFIVLNICIHLHIEYHIAVALGFFIGMLNGYYLNSGLVFGSQRTWHRYVKYFVTSLGGFILTELIITFLHEHAHVQSLNEAKLVAAAIVLIWNFTLSKFWAFK